MKESLNNPFLVEKSKVIFIVLSFMLAACSDDVENMMEPQAVDNNIVKKEQAVKQRDRLKDHWLLKKNGNFLDVDGKLDDQETTLLEADRKEMEIGLKELIQEMDDNLDNPAVRKELAEKMQQNTVEYKQKILLLAKDKLNK